MGRLELLLKLYWGYDEFLPMQQEAMSCVVSGRDSVVVLPTGGGKSLCFQVPAMAADGMCVVVSPLISLMKDQVDALKTCGIDAACINSSMSSDQKHDVDRAARDGRLKLLYVSPERLVSETYIKFLKKCDLSFIAIDEAHCISAWGHDFRPEYRMLSFVKEMFGGIPVHAYTATATEQVREDIAAELRLENPAILVGSFDRPNLIYSVKRADNRFNQICDVIDRHRDESGIIYCISRRETDKICHNLIESGYKAKTYHAGMDGQERYVNQEDFIHERCDIIVATVAFGMGIDKSNVRYVIHNGMPKSVEHYLQESGRAGRDGMPAECVLIYSAADIITWKRILSDLDYEFRESAGAKLKEMYGYCIGIECRHHTLVTYFGEPYEKDGCDACDICLNGVKYADDPIIIGQKILSCVKRVDELFGVSHVACVLKGSKSRKVLEWGHDDLSTYGLLSEQNVSQIRDWIEQLISQGYIQRGSQYGSLLVTDSGYKLLRGEAEPKLLKAVPKSERKSSERIADWDSRSATDREWFERVKQVRLEIANQKNIPAFVVFSDHSLWDMVRKKPETKEEFLRVSGVGEWKAEHYCNQFTEIFRNKAATTD